MDFGLPPSRKMMREMDMTACSNGIELKEDFVKPKPTTRKPIIHLAPDILNLILCKFSASHLQMLRGVCKLWDSLICASHFVQQHLNCQANRKNPGIIALSCKTDTDHYCCSLMFFEEDGHSNNHHDQLDISQFFKASRERRGLWEKPYYSITNSCDGLICVFCPDSVYVMNPSIRKIRALPVSSFTHPFHRMWAPFDIPMVGIGFDSSVGAYKVVRLFRRIYKSEKKGSSGCETRATKLRCEVYTLGVSRSWKKIGDAPQLINRYWNLPSHSPIVVNGAIHWKLIPFPHARIGPEAAFSFNIKDETFDIIVHPEGSSRPPGNWHVVELGGFLCISDAQLGRLEQMNIWVLKDYNNRKWVKQYSIDLMMMNNWSRGSLKLFRNIKPVTIREGKILLSNQEGRIDYYDPETKGFSMQKNSPIQEEKVAPYIGSMIWPVDRLT